MAKSSRADTEKHRVQIIDVASRLLREQGESAVSVQKVMGEVGLTHGGFYKHFASKDELMDLAAEKAFTELIGVMRVVLDSSATKTVAWNQLVELYLSGQHRDDRAGGCANTALASDSARAGDGSGMRSAYLHGVSETLDALKDYQDEPTSPDARHARLRSLITLVGALTLSRATAGSQLSDDLASTAMSMLKEQEAA